MCHKSFGRVALHLERTLQSYLAAFGSQTADNQSVFSDNSVCSLYHPGQYYIGMFLRPVNG